MNRCQADTSLKPLVVGDFRFPLGVRPMEPLEPRPGYLMEFEPGDAGGEDEAGQWEEWPDRYLFDVVISADRLEPLCRALFAMFPGRIYPILDVIAQDAYREIDPFVSYDMLGLDRFLDHLRQFRDFFFEDGLCGFGAMSEEPFLYVFVDEHKIVTIRAEPSLKERVERILQAFDLLAMDEPAGADATAHEHRSILVTPKDRPELLGIEEIVETLHDEWRLVLNIDPEQNLDDEGKELGATDWRVIVRCAKDDPEPGAPPRYAEVLLRASSLHEAEKLVGDAVEDLLETDAIDVAGETLQVAPEQEDTASDQPDEPEEFGTEYVIVAADRVRPEDFRTMLHKAARGRLAKTREAAVRSIRWLADD